VDHRGDTARRVTENVVDCMAGLHGLHLSVATSSSLAFVNTGRRRCERNWGATRGWVL
jgi:hypothetical protein